MYDCVLLVMCFYISAAIAVAAATATVFATAASHIPPSSIPLYSMHLSAAKATGTWTLGTFELLAAKSSFTLLFSPYFL